MWKSRHFLLQIGLLMFLTAGLFLFYGQQVKAAINNDNADYLLSHYAYNNWVSLPFEQRQITREVYIQGINNGLTHQQAVNEAHNVWNSVGNSTTSSGASNQTILSSTPGLSWNFQKQENGNMSLTGNFSNNFHPTVPEENRNFQAIINNRQYNDNDSNNGNVDINNAMNQMDNSQEQDNPTLRGDQTTTNQSAPGSMIHSSGHNTSSSGQSTTECPEGEGLQGMRFLFFHGPLVPCGVNKQCAGNNEGLSINKPCTLCHFIVLIQNFFNLLLSLLIVVSIFMLTVAGVLYIISAGGKMTSMAKEIIQKTLLGFGLFLLSWLIIFTLLSLLSANTSMIGKGDNGIFQFTCDDDSAFYVEPNHQQNPNPPTHQQNPNLPNSQQAPNPSSPSLTSANALAQDQAYRDILRGVGVSINNDNHCTSQGQSGCTTLVGAQEYTINKIMQLKADDCPNCDVQVNAVTDKWIDNNGVAHTNNLHSTRGQYSHDNGYKVDYAGASSLSNYFVGTANSTAINNIPQGQTSGALRRDGYRNAGEYSGPIFYDNEGNQYVYETQKGIWDVTYNRGGR